MKQIISLLCAVYICSNVAAFDLNQAAPGVQFSTTDTESRQRLFTDTKPVKKVFTLGKRDSITDTSIEITPAHELIIKPEKNGARFSFRLAVSKCKKMRLTFSCKATGFFEKNKVYNRMNLTAGAAYMLLRGNTKDLRYYDGDAKKYVRAFTARNGEWFDVTVDITCGENPVFTLNGGKEIKQRGKCEAIKYIIFSGNFPVVKKDTAIIIKNLKAEGIK